MVMLLIEAGYCDSTITLRAGYQNVGSLRSYHNLMDGIGSEQMRPMFASDDRNKRVSETEKSSEVDDVASKRERLNKSAANCSSAPDSNVTYDPQLRAKKVAKTGKNTL